MKKEDFNIDLNKLIDIFELSISENSETYYSTDEIEHEVTTRLTNIAKLGYDLTNIKLAYEILDTNNITAGVKPIAPHKYLFVISKQAARQKNAKYLDMIIYHELCHILQVEFLFTTGLFYYDGEQLKGSIDKKDIINQLYNNNKGHTALWQSFANKINQQLLVNPPITDRLSDKDLTDIFLEDIYNHSFDIDLNKLMDTFRRD